MRIAVLGGGPGGLLAALLAKRGDPGREVIVFERNRAGDTFGFGVVFSDATLDGIDAANPVLRRALTGHGVHWDPIEVRLRGERWRFGGNGMAAVARRTLLTLLQQRAGRPAWTSVLHPGPARRPPRRHEYNLVIAADGANSPNCGRRSPGRVGPERGDRHGEVHLVRHHVADRRADVRPREGPVGVFAVHSYPFGDGVWTFIVETDERTWRAAGLDVWTGQPPAQRDQYSQAYLEKVFASQSAGARCW